ncbi:MAG: VCBS repeat-containing protein, partial [Alcanivoracaceae bacterium]|nr:VCBS repeat-containing protein [Alcanivoracaceae bacterium]
CDVMVAGDFRFELHKDSYAANSSGTVAIAESELLTVLPCISDCTVDQNLVTSSETSNIGPDGTAAGGNGNGILELSDLPTAPGASSKVGSTKGNFSVSPNGAANYSIAVITAAASGGMVPNVTLSYSSQASKSSMGKGWSIGGYSVINRCPQTYDQDYDASSNDPLVMSVNFGATDKFCVDGKRLFLKSGIYGADGATYETELNDFTLYTSTGAQGGGPQCFTAQHKNGNTSYYGNCGLGSNEESSAYVDSGLTATAANNPAFAWAQSRVIDVSGNYYDFAYYSGVVAGFSEPVIEFYPKKVYYSANTTVNQIYKNTIEFIYSTKPLILDTTTVSKVISTEPRILQLINNRSLQRIDSKVGSEFIRSYDFTYNDSDSTGNDLLTSIKECTDSSLITCFEATNFNWETRADDSINATAITPILTFDAVFVDPNTNLQGDYKTETYDANGDGLKDFYITYDKASGGTLKRIALTKADGSGFEIIDETSIPNDLDIKTADKVDINGDGFTDFISHNKVVYLWNGNGYDEGVPLNGLENIQILKYFDLNGDGLPEAISEEFDSISGNLAFYIYNNNMGADPNHNLADIYTGPARHFQYDLTDYEYDNEDPFPGHELQLNELVDFFDYNGDGISEMLFKGEYTVCHDLGQGCMTGEIFEFYVWNIATLISNEDGNWEYDISYLAGQPACADILLCSRAISQPTFIDLDADGSQEICFFNILPNGSGNKTFECYDRYQGDDFYGGDLIYSQYIEKDVDDNVNHDTFIDYNGDGLIDLLFAEGDHDDSTWSVKLQQKAQGKITFPAASTAWVATNTTAGFNNLSTEDRDKKYKIAQNQFLDTNNDGLQDHLLFKVDENDNKKVKVYQSLGTNPQGATAPRDKITSITEGLGDHYAIEYKRMSDSSVYTKANNSVNAWFASGVTPVFDFNSQMSLVANYTRDMPAYDVANANLSGPSIPLENWNQSFDYHYYGGKLQAGGRGFLGFKTVEIFDANNRTLSKTDYHQEFPYTGRAHLVQSYLVDVTSSPASLRASSSFDASVPCWVNNDCIPVVPEPNPCLSQLG